MTLNPIEVLLIEDNPGDAYLIGEMLAEVKDFPFNLEHADRLSKGLEYLSKEGRDVVILDLLLPDSQGFDTFIKAHKKAPEVPIIVLTGLDNEELGIKMIGNGAQDYLVKGQIDSKLLIRSIRYAIERKQAEEALRRSEEQYRNLVETARDIIFTISVNRIITSLNTAFEIICGCSRVGWINKDFTPLIHPDDLPLAAEMHRRVLQGEKPPIFELRIFTSPGDYLIMEVTATPQLRDGKVIGMLGIARDVTQQKRIEKELQRAQKLESIGVLAGGIAHDFNNILTVILGNISLAKTYTSPEDKLYKRITEAEKACLRAKGLNQQLLTFSKGGAPIKKLTFIRGLIKDSVSFAAIGSNTKFEFDIADDLWPVEADEAQISQVINNLVNNAKKAMSEGGVIRVKAENLITGEEDNLPVQAGKYVRLTVADQGIGIPDENLSKIFDPYFTTKEKGSGLGLAVVYSIIKNHDGYVGVESEPGLGAKFYIYIPASEKEIPVRTGLEKLSSLEKKRILVMDDDEVIREFLGEILNQLGYEVEYARDGSEAIEMYRGAKESNRRFDAVIMDLTIPGGMGGKEAIERLKEIDPQVKAIVSSGYSNDPVMSEFKKYGFSDVVAKPYKAEELSRTLYKVINEG